MNMDIGERSFTFSPRPEHEDPVAFGTRHAAQDPGEQGRAGRCNHISHISRRTSISYLHLVVVRQKSSSPKLFRLRLAIAGLR